MKRILVIRLSSLGDIIHTFPMIYDIKQNIECQIDWLVDENFAGVVKLNPHVNRIITLPLRKWKKNKIVTLMEFLKWKKSLKQIEYDYIIDAQGLIKSAFFTKFFKGSVYGLGKYSIKEKLATKFYNYSYETGKEYLAITKNRLLAMQIFNYKINKSIVNFGLNYVNESNHTCEDYAIFFHSTSKNSKKYDINNWVTLADYFIKQYGLNIILPYGNYDEKLEAQKIKQLTASDNIIVCNDILDFDEITKLISAAQFVIGVDTGLVHLANALDKKVITIFVDSNPDKTGVFESDIAKNIGTINHPPLVSDIIDLFEKIK